MKRVFISKNLKECETVLDSFKDAKYHFYCSSLIDFEGIDFELNEDYQVVFFGSVRAYNFFRKLVNIESGIEIACAGRTTANYIESQSQKVDFVPSTPDIIGASKEFKKWVGSKKVVFPISDRSLHTFSKGLLSSQIIERIIYRTKLRQEIIPESDIYFFSSPSNVEAFFLMNKMNPNAQVYAWGKSTENKLKEANIPSILMEAPSLQEVIKILNIKKPA